MLYVDYTRSICAGQNRIHGGGNYTRTILMHLIKYTDTSKIVLLWPEDYYPASNIETEIYHNFNIMQIRKDIDAIDYEPASTLYIPLLGVKEFKILKKLKQKQINLTVTIHGTRLLDLVVDKYDLMYRSKLKDKIKLFFNDISLPIKKMAYKGILKKYSQYIDTVITVSNYSLSRLAKYMHTNDIILQYEDTLPTLGEIPTEKFPKQHSVNYMLFVSGNRPEKNLARTLEAYREYSLQEKDDVIPIHIVGTNESVRCALIHSLKLETEVARKHIVFFDYVSDEELVALYSNASFLVYTSKSEGFGLPALEAAKYGCPVLAAFGTSIPEVLGSNCIYVNPYSVDSIKRGIESMIRERDFFKTKVTNAYKNITYKIQESNEIVIRKLLSL